MTKNILVVDDSFIMRTIIKDIVESDTELKVAGVAENGKIGLQKVRELKPDLILLDIEMPEMSGLEMLKRLMLVAKAKVIVISSVGQMGSPQALEARRLGAADVIAKPSGAMSLDLQQKKGHEIVQAIRRALNMEPGEPPASSAA